MLPVTKIVQRLDLLAV